MRQMGLDTPVLADVPGCGFNGRGGEAASSQQATPLATRHSTRFKLWPGPLLAVPTPNSAPLIAYAEFPAAFEPASLKNGAPISGAHARQEAMLSSARDAFGLPCSF